MPPAPLAIVQCQANGFGVRKIVPLNPHHLGLRSPARSQISYQLHPPYQLRHRRHPVVWLQPTP
jgi:hypothetical protein